MQRSAEEELAETRAELARARAQVAALRAEVEELRTEKRVWTDYVRQLSRHLQKRYLRDDLIEEPFLPTKHAISGV